MRTFIIVALAVAVSGEADPYTIGQVLAGQTNGGVITSTTYNNGVKVAGFPYTGVHTVAPVAAYSGVHAVAPVAAVHHAVAPVAAVPAVHAAYSAYPYASYAYGKREAEPYTIGQIAHGAHIANAAAEGRAPGVITNAAIAPAVHAAYSAYPYAGVYSAASVAPVHATYSAYPYASYPYHAYGKREAEAEAQWGAYPYAGVHAGVYAAAPHAGVYAAAPHAVAATPFGLTHSSNVGVCTNYLGVQVPC